jgi:hypothetical protein
MLLAVAVPLETVGSLLAVPIVTSSKEPGAPFEHPLQFVASLQSVLVAPLQVHARALALDANRSVTATTSAAVVAASRARRERRAGSGIVPSGERCLDFNYCPSWAVPRGHYDTAGRPAQTMNRTARGGYHARPYSRRQ